MIASAVLLLTAIFAGAIGYVACDLCSTCTPRATVARNHREAIREVFPHLAGVLAFGVTWWLLLEDVAYRLTAE